MTQPEPQAYVIRRPSDGKFMAPAAHWHWHPKLAKAMLFDTPDEAERALAPLRFTEEEVMDLVPVYLSA